MLWFPDFEFDFSTAVELGGLVNKGKFKKQSLKVNNS